MDLGLFGKSNRPSRREGLDIGLSKRANPSTRGGVVQSDPRINSVKTSIFTASEAGWGRASEIGCAVEVRDRPELFKVVV